MLLFALILEQIPEYKRKVRQLKIRTDALKEKYKNDEKKQIFTTDINALQQADTVVALLTGRDVDSGTAAELGYAFANNKTLIGIDANNVKFLNIFIWGLMDSGKKILNSLNDLEKYLDEK